MPESMTAGWPQITFGLEIFKSAINAARLGASMANLATSTWSDLLQDSGRRGADLARSTLPGHFMGYPLPSSLALDLWERGAAWSLKQATGAATGSMDRLDREWMADTALLDLFSSTTAPQDWSVAYDDDQVIMDLPSLRAIDISLKKEHAVRNYTVVFAPRAGHHSNIAERVALHLRDSGLSRLVIVEQKCADDIPLEVDGELHGEGFQSQVDQYAAVLSHVHRLAVAPSHLVAVCQPGPLLMATLIKHPHLGRTFGSAGSPMHTEAQRGFLTDFSRLVGPGFIDMMLAAFGRRIGSGRPGAGRTVYDGSLQVLGFYLLGRNQHLRNLRKLRSDLVAGNKDGAERQQSFYRWYNSVHHFPAGFIRDTFKQVFVKNALVRGQLRIGEETVGIGDYPAGMPIWAIGGNNDEIVPPLQATGHMDLLDQVPDDRKLTIHCDAGHMGLFRSRNVLAGHYSAVARFILAHSDPA